MRGASYTKYTNSKIAPSFSWQGAVRVQVRVEEVLFPNKNNPGNGSGYHVAIVTLLADPESNNALIRRTSWATKLAGKVSLDLERGRVYQITASWEYGKKYGEWQLVPSITEDISTEETITDIQTVLETVSNIGPVRAGRLVATLGKKTYETLDKDEEGRAAFLAAGLPKSFLEETVADYREKRKLAAARKLLLNLNINSTTISAILRDHKEHLKEHIQADPVMILSYDVDFDKAKHVWERCEIPSDDSRLITAAVYETLVRDANKTGNCYMPETTALSDAGGLLGLPTLREEWYKHDLEFSDYARKHTLIDDEGKMWLRRLWDAEESIASRLTALMGHPGKISDERLSTLSEIVDDVLKENNFEPSPGQRAALMGIPRNRVSILTGPAGTGKTTVERMLMHVFIRLGMRTIRIAAPTGAAARRATRACGGLVRATTIHKLLEMLPTGLAGRDEYNPLDADVIFVDEASMVTVSLAAQFLRAVREGTHVVFVGDPNQLPAVGPGAVLRDLIDSQRIPHFALSRKEVFRQAADSGLLKVAYAILDSKEIALALRDKPRFADVDVYSGRSSEEIVKRVIKLWNEYDKDPSRIKFVTSKWGKKEKDPETGMDVYKDAGVNRINEEIIACTPFDGDPWAYMGYTFYPEMHCIWRKNTNDEELPLVNGQEFSIVAFREDEELGSVMDIETLDDMGEQVEYVVKLKDYRGDFRPGYCSTIHSTQGNEYDTVVYILQPGDFLTREGAYTAVTRGKKRVIIIGETSPLWRARSEVVRRKTQLTSRIEYAVDSYETPGHVALAPIHVGPMESPMLVDAVIAAEQPKAVEQPKETVEEETYDISELFAD